MKPFEGLMMRTPLLVRSIAERAGQLFAEREVVSLTGQGVERSTYSEVVQRARRLASSPAKQGTLAFSLICVFQR